MRLETLRALNLFSLAISRWILQLLTSSICSLIAEYVQGLVARLLVARVVDPMGLLTLSVYARAYTSFGTVQFYRSYLRTEESIYRCNLYTN